MKRALWLVLFLSLLMPVPLGFAGSAAPEPRDLERAFASPPQDSRPWVYWMWVGGNISKEGITADLEAMKRVGIGGALIMNLGVLSDDPVSKDPVLFMTPAWREMARFAFAEAARLGLQIDMNNDDGWNCGGPWIKPEQAMQKLTWSETRVSGPSRFAGVLAQPATTSGTYHDIAVLALPAPPPMALPAAKKTVLLTTSPLVQLAYARPVTARSITVTVPTARRGSARPGRCELQVSADGKSFRSVTAFDTGWMSATTGPGVITIGFEAVRGRFFRLLLPELPPQSARLVNFTLQPEAHVSHWAYKAGFSNILEHGGRSPLYALAGEYPKPAAGAFIPQDKIVNLTGRMAADGRLEWDAPEGTWTILRLGYTPTGKPNGFATDAGRGLDCDKLSRPALEAHLAGMIDKLLADAGPLAGKSLNWVHDDSWESGPLNWTAAFPEEFKKRRGYDPIPWLPVMAGGCVVGSLEESERFLWDVRRTIADLITENHLKPFRELAHQRGLKFSSESTGRQQFMYDPITFQVTSDLPMGEFWANEARVRPDCKVAASAAHLMGLPVVGAEAFTGGQGGRWQDTPYSLKTLGDSAFCFGVNHFVFHRMLLQRWPERRPGLAWPTIGVNFDSTNTWWDPSSAWIDYLARCQVLLRQGRFVADAAILTGEGAPNPLIRLLQDPIDPSEKLDTSTVTEGTLRRFNQMPALPPVGYDYDGVNPEAVRQMTVRDGQLVHPGGMQYRMLVLPPEPRMTAALARKVKDLVAAGAVVIGPRPLGSPTLADFPKGDAEVRAIAAEVWGDCDGVQATMHAYGKGRVFWGRGAEAALEALKLPPDFSYQAQGAGAGDVRLDFIHRRTADAEIYFVSNQRQAPVEATCAFRAQGRTPELWFPDTGKTRPCPEFTQRDGRTFIPLRLDPAGSLFVIFRQSGATKPATPGMNNAKNFPDLKTVLQLNSAWEVRFDPKLGGPASMRFEEPYDWTRCEMDGIKYYSGTATYKNVFDIPQSAIQNPQSAIYLDLGVVKEMARVRINGKDLGVLWKPPFRVEITGAVQEKGNRLEVEVTNLWVNRLIGDAALPEEKRLTHVNWNPYTANSPLRPSGLIGPVTVQRE